MHGMASSVEVSPARLPLLGLLSALALGACGRSHDVDGAAFGSVDAGLGGVVSADAGVVDDEPMAGGPPVDPVAVGEATAGTDAQPPANPFLDAFNALFGGGASAYADCEGLNTACGAGGLCQAVPSLTQAADYCAPPCATDVDCPTPGLSLGTTTAVCGLGGYCELPCDGTPLTCPIGMSCVGLFSTPASAVPDPAAAPAIALPGFCGWPDAPAAPATPPTPTPQ